MGAKNSTDCEIIAKFGRVLNDTQRTKAMKDMASVLSKDLIESDSELDVFFDACSNPGSLHSVKSAADLMAIFPSAISRRKSILRAARSALDVRTVLPSTLGRTNSLTALNRSSSNMSITNLTLRSQSYLNLVQRSASVSLPRENDTESKSPIQPRKNTWIRLLQLLSAVYKSPFFYPFARMAVYRKKVLLLFGFCFLFFGIWRRRH
jgi:hypothetical protein